MMRHACFFSVRTTLWGFIRSLFPAHRPGSGGRGSLKASARRQMHHAEPAFQVVYPNYDRSEENVGKPLCETPSTACWLCLGFLAAAGACSCRQENRRHQLRIERENAQTHGQCTNGVLKNVFTNVLHCRERWVTAAVTTAFFLSSSPAVFRSGAPALCRELSRQRVERELQQSPEPLKLQQVFRKIEPLVVQVYAVLQTQAPFAHKALGQTEFDEEQHAHEQYHFLGSGFFFDDEAAETFSGHIVTAAHVVLQPSGLGTDAAICPKSREPQVQRVDGNFVPFPLCIKDSLGRLHEARLCGLDETTDVAVLRVNNSFQGKECPHVHGKFAVTRPEMGEIIATYAATEHANEPIGVAGQVLQPRQTFRPTDDSGNLGLLQLQLLTLPGMSGAPVVDMEGSIVGMLVKKFDICGLALPSAVVLRVAESLRDSGKFTVPSIGLLVTEEMPRLAAARPNLPTGSGLKVCRVTPGSAADRAGVREGDLIINVKGEVMDSIGRVRIPSPSQSSSV